MRRWITWSAGRRFRVVLTGGQGYGEEITEAACMYAYLTEHGVDPQRLILEEHAGNTSENFFVFLGKAEQVGIDPAPGHCGGGKQ